MQPNQPKKFFDISPGTPSNIIRPTTAVNPTPSVPEVRKISVNEAPIQKPPSDLFKPLSSVMPVAPTPTVPPTQSVPSAAPLPPVATQAPLSLTPATEVPKFGSMQSKVDAHPLFSGQKDIVPKARGKILSKLFWIAGIILVILAGIYVAIDSGAINTNINLPFHIFGQATTTTQPTITSTQSASKLKSIVYNNAKGQNFNMKFYDQFSLKPPLGTTSGIQALVSKTSLSNKAPLTIFIATIEGTATAAQASYDRYKDCSLSFPLVLNAVNSYVSQTINACRVSLEPSTYIAVFTSGTNKYIVTISQDTEWSKSLASPSSAQSALSSLDLSVYDNDIKEILSSIQPV